MVNCQDCGNEMSEPRLCLVMFSPLDQEVNRKEGFNRVSNLCERCRGLKRIDAMKAYPPRARRPVRRLTGTSEHVFAFECLKNRWVPDPVTLTGRPLWLYGKGELGRLAQEFFRYVGVEVAGWFENDESTPLDAQVAVCIVRNAPYGVLERQLFDRGFRDIVPFYDLTESIVSDHPWKNGWVARPGKDDYEGMERVLGHWSDEASSAHHLSFLAWRILREEWVFGGMDVTKDNLFFIPEVVDVLHDHEVFLDGGAHDGEISAKFADLSPGTQIIAVEPDDANRLEFRRRHSHSVADFALSDLDDRAPFAQGFGLCSKLMPEGKATKTTRRIDSLGISPTFIKLHLEGGELPALRGAEQTLMRCRPIVAVRIDHNADGLWRTADYLMNLLSDYHFLFRNHCWCGAAAAVYAIPKERGE